MALERIRFDVVGDKQYSRAFEMAAEEAEDLSDPLRKIGVSLISSVHDQFRTEGAHGLGSKWQPLNPAYASWKRQQVGEQPILVFSGKMRASMISPGAITVSPRRLVYAPNTPDYAIKHQVGEPGDTPPQRQMIAVPMSVRRDWDREFVHWLNDLRVSRQLL